jgi:soluble lytic murein transglycosylase
MSLALPSRLTCVAFVLAIAPVQAAVEKAPELDAELLAPYFATGKLLAAADAYNVGNFEQAAKLFAENGKGLRSGSKLEMPVRMLRALSLGEAAKPTEAAAIFESLWQAYPLLSDYHAYQAARAHLLIGNTESALTWAARVDKDAVMAAEAELIALEALERLKKWDELEKRATTFLEQFEQGPRRAEARFRQTLAMENLGRAPAKIVEFLRMIWRLAPTETWAKRAEERIAVVVDKLPNAEAATLRAPTSSDWLERGMALGEKQQHKESEDALAMALKQKSLDPGQTCVANYNLAQAIFKQRQRPRAVPYYAQAEVACRAANDNDLTVKSLYQGARCRASAGDRKTARTLYVSIEKDFAEHGYADDARLRTAELHQDEGDVASARAVLSEIPRRYPEGDMLGEALFRLAFSSYQTRDFAEASRWLQEELKLIPHETVWYAEGRALYWLARIEEQQKHKTSAVSYYERAIRQYPLSVYALQAFERLRSLGPEKRRELISTLHQNMGTVALPVEFGRHPVYATAGFQRAVELARLGLGDWARRELSKVEALAGFESRETRDGARAAGKEQAPARERALWLTAVVLNRGRVWSASHAIPRYTLMSYKAEYPKGQGAAAWRLSYPRAFPEIVEHNSKANKVPQFLQLAIMREESAFNPRIESFANAIGLTQMLVTTAQRFSTSKINRDTLFNPASNLELGSKFLGFLLNHFPDATPLAISGYNAGEAAVDRWLVERGNLPLDEFMETIPYDETRGYTKRVLASYFAYTWLYGTGEPVPKLSFALKKAKR